MHPSAQQEYGLRCLLRIAERAEEAPVSVAAVAEAEGISPEYAARLMGPLRRAGLVTSTRGAAGGYRLGRPADEISVWDVLQALGRSFFAEGFCDCHSGQRRECVRATDCSIRALWRRADRALREAFAAISLADLQRSEQPMVVWLDAPQLAFVEHPHG